MKTRRRLGALVPAGMLAAVLVLSGCAATPPATGGSGTNTTPRKGSTVTAIADEPIPSAGCGKNTPIAAGETVTRHISSGGQKRTYELHLPADYTDTTSTPLILAFHARGGDGASMASYTGLSTSNAVVAYPDGLVSHGERSWESAPYASGADDVAFVSDLITHLQSTLCIDPDRIFAAGKSNGGGFTALLACTLPHRIAAFGIVSGAFYETTSARCTTPIPSPIVEFHGTADPVIRYTGGTSHGTRYQAIGAWLQDQAGVDGCQPDATQALVGDDVTRLTWTGCDGRGALVHYRIDDGGHTWPGAHSTSGPGKTTQTISATAVMLDFFAAHPLTGDAG